MSMQMQSEKKKAAVQERHSLTTPPSPESPPPQQTPTNSISSDGAKTRFFSSQTIFFWKLEWPNFEKKCDVVN